MVVKTPRKKKVNKEEVSEKAEVPVEKKSIVTRKKESPFVVAPFGSELWRAFDDIFDNFRTDFEELLFPTPWRGGYPAFPEIRVPLVDLEDRGKDFLLKAEMPGFKKEDIEIEVQEDSIEITGRVGWKYDKKAKGYVCKERACESFNRNIQLPEDVNTDAVTANLADGILEIILPKKTPKKTRKISL